MNIEMYAWGFVALLVIQWVPKFEKIRVLEYNGSRVQTTFNIDTRFLGRYAGSKEGYVLLNVDGSGVYKYDYEGLSPDCEGEEIEFNWGFILDDNYEIVRFQRDYGYSYPIIYNCSGPNAFQGCTKRAMIDYLLEYSDGTITVSSSDDWTKQHP